MAADRQVTIKRSIKPVTITLTLTASKVNENGTFSGFTVQSFKGPNAAFKVSIPPSGGGSIYLKVDPNHDKAKDNIEMLDVDAAGAAAPVAKVKLF